MTYRIVPCPKCNQLHGVEWRGRDKRGPAHPYDGPPVSPLRASRPTPRPVPASDLGSARGNASAASTEVPERRRLGRPVDARTASHLPQPATPVAGSHPGRREDPSPAVRGNHETRSPASPAAGQVSDALLRLTGG